MAMSLLRPGIVRQHSTPLIHTSPLRTYTYECSDLVEHTGVIPETFEACCSKIVSKRSGTIYGHQIKWFYRNL